MVPTAFKIKAMTFSIRHKCVYLEILSDPYKTITFHLTNTKHFLNLFIILKLMVAQTVKNLLAMWETWV